MVLGGTLINGGKGSIIGTARAVLIGVLKFGLPMFGVNMQYLDIPVGLLLLVVVCARAVSQRPEVVAFMHRLVHRNKA